MDKQRARSISSSASSDKCMDGPTLICCVNACSCAHEIITQSETEPFPNRILQLGPVCPDSRSIPDDAPYVLVDLPAFCCSSFSGFLFGVPTLLRAGLS